MWRSGFNEGFIPSHVHTDRNNMRYNPRTDNAMDIDAIAKQCMDAVKRSHVLFGSSRDDEYHGDINYGNAFPEGWYWMNS